MLWSLGYHFYSLPKHCGLVNWQLCKQAQKYFKISFIIGLVQTKL